MNDTINAFAPRHETQIYYFEASAGDEITYDGLGGANVRWDIFGPNLQYLTGNPQWADGSFTARQSGRHLLVITGSASVDENYAFRLIERSDLVANPIAFDQTITGAIAFPGDEDTFSFDRMAGQRIYFERCWSIGVSVLLGVGDGSFSNPAQYSTGRLPQQPSLADVEIST